MPKLKKFRVVNLVYNDIRHIYDEVFDFGDGSNAMMLLANGGGKTVLTQMMLQPVIPKTDLKTRKFADYFKNNSKPTLLISEWSLDDDAGTILSGLVIKHQIRKKRGQDDNRELLNIQAFVIQYHYNETYNIDTVPGVRRDSQGRKLMQTYEEILSDLQKHQRKHPAYVSLFNWSDSREAKDLYAKKLAEYGINQQEWRDNILKINKEEAGLQSFFDDAKTSTTLLKRKILPNIESKLDEHIREKVEIQTLVKNHARELVKNDRIIKDKKLYEDFIEASGKYQSQTGDLEAAVRSHEGALMSAAQLHHGLVNYLMWVDEVLENLGAQIKGNRREITQISFEEACYKYYKKENELLLKQAESISLEEQVAVSEKSLSEAKYRSDCMKAAGLLVELTDLKKEITESRLKLEQIHSAEKAMDIRGLVSVLIHKYREKKEDLQTIGRGLVDEMKGINEDVEKQSRQLQILRNKMAKQQKASGAVESRLKGFDAKVHQMSVSYSDFVWDLHPLFLTYEKEALEVFSKSVGDQIEARNRAEDRISTQLADCHKKQTDLFEEEKALNLELLKLDNDLKSTNREMEDYLSKYERCASATEQWGIEKDRFFEVDYGKDILSSGIRSREERDSHLVIDRSMVLQMAESLKAGQLYTLPDEVTHFLDSNGIDYDYGYKWVREYQGEDLPSVLYMEKLPVLPYALVMSHGDMLRFISAVKDYHLSNVIPVVSHRHIQQALQNQLPPDSVDNPFYHTSFNIDLLNEAYVTEEIRILEERVSEIDRQIELVRKSRRELQNVLHTYIAFHNEYSEVSFKKMLGQKDALEQSIEKGNTRLLVLAEEMTDLIKEISRLEDKQKECVEDLQTLKEKKGRVQELSVDYEGYLKDCNEQRSLEDAVKASETAIKKHEEAINMQKSIISQKQLKVNEVSSDISGIEAAIGKIDSGDLLADVALARHPLNEMSIEHLEIQYDLYARNNGDADNIGKLLRALVSSKEEYEKELASLKVAEADLDDLVYEAHMLPLLEKETKVAAKNLQRVSDSLKELGGEIRSLEKTVAEKAEEILEKYSVEKLVAKEELTDTDFRGRRNANKASHQELLIEQKEKSSLKAKADNAKGRIEDLDESIRTMPCEAFTISEDITVVELDRRRESVIRDVKRSASVVKECQNQTKRDYDALKSRFHGENDLLTNMFSNLLTGDNAYDDGFVRRVFKQTYESINRTMEKYAADLNNMERSRDQLYEFALNRVSDIYDELRDIDKHSVVELGGKRQKMLHILLPKKETLDTSELKGYLTEVIKKAKKRIEENELSELEIYLDSHLSLEQLFDMYLPIRRIKVKITKIEQNRSSVISWEEVGKVSGGEVFVSVFILFISLLSYTRGYHLSRKQSGKVLVMDNPFGPVSSEHLLEPLFKIAETYDTQLICFTHINTSAITSQFDLIYSMRVVRELGSNKEHVDVSVAKDTVKGIERVENSLFEIGDGDQLGFL